MTRLFLIFRSKGFVSVNKAVSVDLLLVKPNCAWEIIYLTKKKFEMRDKITFSNPLEK
ncbi:MAG: hypothetical protein O7D30_06500 [Rickettsia endosymbiont of Ixodes persulcatus]|nr:hypothetical protein [Rickettsia endosymbiont of Ixodes persulcatus]